VRDLAPGVRQLDGWPPDTINVYVIEDVLIDAGTRFDQNRILRQLAGQQLAAHALTHAHPDHLGSSHGICEQFGIPFWVGERDADAAEDPGVLATQLPHLPFPGATAFARFYVDMQVEHGHPVDRRLHEGDEVAGFRVLDTPGHSPGHIAFWRESDRVLIAGDVMWNFEFAGGRPGLTAPLPASSSDPAVNRASARRLAKLEPALICFGHGPPMRDTAKFVRVIESLPNP
jgi:hydroxyacylglutathione hydrolase